MKKIIFKYKFLGEKEFTSVVIYTGKKLSKNVNALNFSGKCAICGKKIKSSHQTDLCLKCEEDAFQLIEDDKLNEEENKLAKHALRQQGWPNEAITSYILENKKIILQTKRKIKDHDYESSDT